MRKLIGLLASEPAVATAVYLPAPAVRPCDPQPVDEAFPFHVIVTTAGMPRCSLTT
jgi:hypothetical protein